MVSYFTFTADTAVTGLNPCCSGRWSRTVYLLADRAGKLVLILVVVEDGLVLSGNHIIIPVNAVF